MDVTFRENVFPFKHKYVDSSKLFLNDITWMMPSEDTNHIKNIYHVVELDTLCTIDYEVPPYQSLQHSEFLILPYMLHQLENQLIICQTLPQHLLISHHLHLLMIPCLHMIHLLMLLISLNLLQQCHYLILLMHI